MVQDYGEVKREILTSANGKMVWQTVLEFIPGQMVKFEK